MKKNVYCLITIALFFLFACKKENETIVNTEYSIRIDKPVGISIEDFIVDIDTIRLETNDKSIMSDIINMYFMDDRYYILANNRNSVLIFNKDGEYISRIDDKGRGPAEYVTIHSFNVDKINKRLILADSFSNRIFIYDKDGKQIEVIQLGFTPRVIVPHSNGFLNIYSGSRNQYDDPRMENFNVHFLDGKGEFIFSAIEIETPERIDIGSWFMTDILDNGDILFQPVLSDVVYKIEGGKVIPFYGFINASDHKLLNQKEKRSFKFDTSENKNEFKEKEKKGYLLSWGAVKDLTDYVFFSFGGWDKKYYLYYSKRLDNTLFIDPDKVNGNKYLKEIFLSYPKTVDGNKFYISPNQYLINEVKDKLPEGMIKTFLENTDFDSNPVLISFSIKFPGE